jgi:Putative zinc-finger
VEPRLDCREAARLLSVAQDRALSPAEIEALQDHLGRCLMCRNYESHLKFLRAALEHFRTGSS